MKMPALRYVTGALFALLIVKFFYAAFVYDVPLGFDPGIYRYLFLKYASVLPPFELPQLKEVFQEHPMGLFVPVAYLLKAGVPVDWFLGWIWNVTAIAVVALYAWVWSQKKGSAVGVAMLLIGLLSVSYYEAYALMYWKTIVALGLMVLTLYFLESRLFLALLTGAATVAVHHQTGLLLLLSLLAWWICQCPYRYKDKSFLVRTAVLVGIALLGSLVYLPHLDRFLLVARESLSWGSAVESGEFLTRFSYVQMSWLLVVAGATGLLHDFQKRPGTVWQCALVVSAVFVLGSLVFYERFLIHLDLLLWPFAAMFMVDIWKQHRSREMAVVLAILLAIQGWISWNHFTAIGPKMTKDDIVSIAMLNDTLPPKSMVISLDPASAVWLLGWMPDQKVGGPGLFDFPGWSEKKWTTILTSYDKSFRYAEFKRIRKPGKGVYFYVSPFFESYYGSSVRPLLADPCLQKVDDTNLLQFTCQ